MDFPWDYKLYMDFPNILKLVMYSKHIDMHVEEFLFFMAKYGIRIEVYCFVH